jgi:cell division septation protein DedD
MKVGKDRWLLSAFAILLILVAVWVIGVLQLDPAAAESSRISLSLRSRISANFGPDSGGPLAALRLSIVGDVLNDLGLGPAGQKASEALMEAMLTPVPTATAYSYEGDPPPTATPVISERPTGTPIPTSTITPAPSTTGLPTARPSLTPSATAKPTERPTSTKASPADDTRSPQLSGGNLSPGPGSLSCTQEIHISGLRVLDPDYSSGINYVKLKYQIEAPDSNGLIYGDQLDRTSGGFTSPGHTWDARYSGSIVIDFNQAVGALLRGGRTLAKPVALPPIQSTDETPTPTATPTATDTPAPTATNTPVTPTATNTPETPTATLTPTSTPSSYAVILYAIAEDKAGHSRHITLGTYSIPSNCR